MAQKYGGPSSPQEKLNARVHFYEIPDQGFNPLEATPAELDRYGIPRRPDPQIHARSAAFWLEMFAPPLNFVDQILLLSETSQRISKELRVTSTGQREASLNWSGLYVTPRDGRQITEIHGRWTVPTVSVPDGMPPGDEYSSSIWIGLDGQRRYFDSSLPQIGTTQSINDPNKPPYWSWCQWWLRDNPDTYQPALLAVPVAPGNVMMASIHVLSATRAHFLLKNQTTNDFVTFDLDAPVDAMTGRRPLISGATAEWITERPTNVDTGEMYVLPDYGEVQFTNCLTVRAEPPRLGPPGSGIEQTLDGARLIRMYEVRRQPSRTATISKAEVPTVDAFKTVYVP